MRSHALISMLDSRPVGGAAPARSLLAPLAEHRSLMLGITAAVVAYAATAGSPGTFAQLALLAAAVAVVGLPHGALDHLVARQLFRPVFGARWWLPFTIGYLSLAGFMGALWLALPTTALVTFLALSALHFGWDDPVWTSRASRGWNSVERFAVGAMPIVLPTWLHATEVTIIFDWLVPSRIVLDPAVVGALAGCAAAAVLPIVGLRFARLAIARQNAAAAELAAIATLHVVAPPLIAFLTYFCGWHSIRHALELADDLAPGQPGVGLRRFAREAVPLTLLTVVAAAVSGVAFFVADVAINNVLASVVFIGLSVLTVPHMAMMALGRAAVNPGPIDTAR
jgi:Brp/Blh family beta-carotene 15,15'-monooxygenase